MEVAIKTDCAGVDWRAVSETLKRVGMAYYDPELHKKAFTASFATVFVYKDGGLIGFGRAISDGAYQAAIYDCAVLPQFQAQGVGKTIMDNLLSALSHCNIILYASPGKEGFYRALGFSRMKTGMARFIKKEAMKERGFTE